MNGKRMNLTPSKACFLTIHSKLSRKHLISMLNITVLSSFNMLKRYVTPYTSHESDPMHLNLHACLNCHAPFPSPPTHCPPSPSPGRQWHSSTIHHHPSHQLHPQPSRTRSRSISNQRIFTQNSLPLA